MSKPEVKEEVCCSVVMTSRDVLTQGLSKKLFAPRYLRHEMSKLEECFVAQW
jgi:hypothetical protein